MDSAKRLLEISDERVVRLHARIDELEAQFGAAVRRGGQAEEVLKGRIVELEAENAKLRAAQKVADAVVAWFDSEKESNEEVATWSAMCEAQHEYKNRCGGVAEEKEGDSKATPECA
jgi:hypothetical protein